MGSFFLLTQMMRWKAAQNSLLVSLPSRSASAIAKQASSCGSGMPDCRNTLIASYWLKYLPRVSNRGDVNGE